MKAKISKTTMTRQQAARAALAAKRGKVRYVQLKGPARVLYQKMTEAQLAKWAAPKKNTGVIKKTVKKVKTTVRAGTKRVNKSPIRRTKVNKCTVKKVTRNKVPSLTFSDLPVRSVFKLPRKIDTVPATTRLVKTGKTSFQLPDGSRARVKNGSLPVKLLVKSKPKRNPTGIPRGAIEIYDDIHAIEARKGRNSNWPGEDFRHDFEADKGKAKIYGLPDGSLLIKGKKRLFRKFKY